ncbi:hypothetical protein ASPCAL07323 [Aspergillus calidoustus]|uniref:DUF7729 domain-containing protein n=1 Tax=Aspergillus calidoustus TaxID=454130 RepID=A0A0U5G7D0_ASPCI|nr:hypothetical protein ASPCAL07323 [Aspergillus calidoustus]
MHHQTPTGLLKLSRTLFLATLALPAALAQEKPADSALESRFSRPGPDQGIVDIVPVADAPPVSVHINAPVAIIYEHDENKDSAALLPRASSPSPASSTSFPTTFDTSLSTNFTTDSCSDFITETLASSSFTDCHAISTLLRDSTGFFHTLTSAASTSHVLDIACAADVSSCADTMSDLAADLLDDNNCGIDYADGNPLVSNAYVNMITYEPIYRATCLQSPDTTNYCFVDAVTNTSNPEDYDVYLIPYGSVIDTSPYPTCNACLQATLDVFSQWAQVDGQPLAGSYLPSAKAVNRRCGSDFANVNITVGETSSTSEDNVPHTDASVKLSVSLPLYISLSAVVGSLLSI